MKRTERILLVEDDDAMRDSCRQVLESVGHEVLEACSPVEAEPLLLREVLDLVLTDLRMPNGGGQEVLRLVKHATPDVPVVLITAYPSIDSAVEAFRGGVADYLLKPFTGPQLIDAVDRVLAARRARDATVLLKRAGPASADLPDMIGQSPSFRELLTSIRRVATLDGNVLILGETGSGKELVARATHGFSRYAAGPFTVVNCAAIPESLIEAELFGFERGAFTGAANAKRGLFEEADHGSLFLDEVGELAAVAQAKLLRCIEEGAVRRLGATSPRAVDNRIIAATHKDLRAEVRAGRFREDLLFRLEVLDLRVPPLRERKSDIPLLAASFLTQINERSNRDIAGFSEEAMERMIEYPWPGNVRELQNVVQKALARTDGPVIEARDLVLAGSLHSVEEIVDGSDPQPPQRRGTALADFERQQVTDALDRHQGNVTHTAEELGIHRTTLQRIMKRLGISHAPNH